MLSLDGQESVPSNAVHRHPPTVARLVLPDVDRSGSEVYVIPPEGPKLTATHPGMKGYRDETAQALRQSLQEAGLFLLAEAAVPRVVRSVELDRAHGVIGELAPGERRG